MDVASLPKSALKLSREITRTFSSLSFKQDEVFFWSASDQTVHFRPCKQARDIWYLLHECAHGLLGHVSFKNDIALLQMEVEAWRYAQTELALQFEVVIPQDIVEKELDTYRAWLDARSTCPKCGQTGLQTKTSTYQCINCQCSWMVNDARQCRLRRRVMPLEADR